jgi:hypothetical protein
MSGQSPAGPLEQGQETECVRPASVTALEDGFGLPGQMAASGPRIVRWVDVREVRTYKRDLLSYDPVSLAFYLDDGTCIDICEDTPGFKEVATGMRHAFPEIPQTWFWDAAMSPFATNETVLYPFNADQYAALQEERQAASDRDAEQARRWPTVPLIDWLCLAVGLGAAMGCVTRGSGLWGWGVLSCGILTVISSFMIRRVYRVRGSSPEFVMMVVDVLRRQGIADNEIHRCENQLTAHNFWRAVPLAVGIAFTGLRLLNVGLLAVTAIQWR